MKAKTMLKTRKYRERLTVARPLSAETSAERAARIAGYDEALVGLMPLTENFTDPVLIEKYEDGFNRGRIIRARRFGARRRRSGRPADCPDEFRTQETREAYALGYQEG